MLFNLVIFILSNVYDIYVLYNIRRGPYKLKELISIAFDCTLSSNNFLCTFARKKKLSYFLNNILQVKRFSITYIHGIYKMYHWASLSFRLIYSLYARFSEWCVRHGCWASRTRRRRPRKCHVRITYPHWVSIVVVWEK